MAVLAMNGGTPVRTAPWPSWPVADAHERGNLQSVLDSGHWWSTEGTQVAAFEAEFAAFCATGSCMAATNGSHAIEIALLAAGIGAGDELIVPDYTFFATAAAVAAVNAVPIPVDIDPATFCIDPDTVVAAIGTRTRAVITVHLAGHPADLDRLGELCARHDLVLIEDCAHAHGSRWRDRPVGSFGAAGTFSFQQSKFMTAGEGGAVVSSDQALAEGMPLTVSYPPIHRIAAFTDPDGLAPRHRDRSGWPDFSAMSLPHSRAAAAGTLWFRRALLLGERADADQLVEALWDAACALPRWTDAGGASTT